MTAVSPRTMTDRDLARRLGLALSKVISLSSVRRPRPDAVAHAEAEAALLRVEMGSRIVDGSWEAWEVLGVNVAAEPGRRSDGEGAIYFDQGRQRWIAEVTKDGKRHRRVGATRKEAADALRAVTDKIERGLPVAENRWTVAAWCLHVGEVVLPQEGARANTLSSYRGSIERHVIPALGHHRLTTLQPAHVRSMIAAMTAKGLAPNTIRLARGALRRALGIAQAEGLIARNVVGLTRAPKITTKAPLYLDLAEVRRLLDYCAQDDSPFGDVVALMVLSGLRRGEVLGLRWDDALLDSAPARLRIERALISVDGQPVLSDVKTDAGKRTIALPAEAVEVLRRRRRRQAAEQLAAGAAWDNPDGAVFTNPLGRRLHPDNLTKGCRRVTLAALDRGLNPHALRHTSASLLALAGAHAKVVQEHLGHSTPELALEVYQHTFQEQEVAAAVAIDGLLARDG